MGIFSSKDKAAKAAAQQAKAAKAAAKAAKAAAKAARTRRLDDPNRF